MIVQERFEWDGRWLVKTTSDSGFMVCQDGTGDLYAEATDPEEMGRSYTETDIPIESDEEPAEEEDFLEALASLGVNV